jgi:hypothetical protein
LDRVEFLQEVQREKGVEDHNIEILSDEQLPQMYSTAKHWESIVEELKEKVEEEWEQCNRAWEKVNQTMANLRLPTFGSPLDFPSIDKVSTGL